MREKQYESANERLKAWREKQRNVSLPDPETFDKRNVSTPNVSPCPKGHDPAIWAYACERAARARRYAAKMPDHVRPREIRFQDPAWQYADQARYPLPA